MNEIKTWKDETGMEIPVSRITKNEKHRERMAKRLLKLALILNEKLSELKTEFRDICREVYDAALEENNIDKATRKGNFTWFNFDRSIKIETNINELIKFDPMLIGMCQAKLNEFLDNAIQATDDFIKPIIMEAFTQSRGDLDAKRVMGLLKHKSRIKDSRYHEAMDLLEKSITRPSSKTYFRIHQKDTEGEYQSIDLNFSSVDFLTLSAPATDN